VGTNYYYHADGLGSVTEITTNILIPLDCSTSSKQV